MHKIKLKFCYPECDKYFFISEMEYTKQFVANQLNNFFLEEMKKTNEENELQLCFLTHYRDLLSWHCCICQSLEQHLFFLLKKEALMDRKENCLSNEFWKIKNAYMKIFKINFEEISSWNKIQELQCLVNVIKHAEGKSMEDLKLLRPDFFNERLGSAWARDALYSPYLEWDNLKISISDFSSYCDAIIMFIKKFPEWCQLEVDQDQFSYIRNI